MKKILLLFTIAVILTSCGNLVPTYQNQSFPYKIVEINNLDQSDFHGLCKYRVETGVDNLFYIDNYNVVDSIGKFKIGDEVNFKLIVSK